MNPVYIVAGPSTSMLAVAQMAAHANHTRPVSLCVPLSLVKTITPATSLYYKYSRQKPLFTAFAVEPLETPSNFNTDSSTRTLGFRYRPIQETIQDTVDFRRSIFRIDADCIVRDGIPVQKQMECMKTACLAGTALTAAAILCSHLRRSRQHRRV